MKRLYNDQIELFGDSGSKRIHKNDDEKRKRNPYKRDYARVMYSNSFRRLQGKMQLMEIDGNKFNRNRLTHSLEVSQIARSIAEVVSESAKESEIDIYTEEDMYVVETGAYAHDIGNAPFGHHGEVILNGLMKEFGGFEGNAQSLRILMEIEKKFPKHKGLNLTLRSLLSIVKYYVPYERNKDKFLYSSEFETLDTVLKDNDLSKIARTIDVQIVDAADEIAYCAHDLEDALAQKYFTIDDFLFELELDSKNNEYTYQEEFNEFREWVKEAKNYAENSEVYSSSEEYSFIFRKELTSIIVDSLIRQIDILDVSQLKGDFRKITGTRQAEELAFKNWRLVRGIKHCTFKCINRSNTILIYEKIGTKVIEGLFEAFNDKKFNKGLMLLPVEYRGSQVKGELDENMRHRMISDYIGGMMDSYAIETYKNIYGKNKLTQLV